MHAKNWKGIEFQVNNAPPADEAYIPMEAALRAHQKSAEQDGGQMVSIAVRRAEDDVSVFDMRLHKSEKFADADKTIAERVAKFMLWMKGGYEIAVYGGGAVGEYIAGAYREGGAREFDAVTMERVYERPFAVRLLPYSEKIENSERALPIGGNMTGCRIGFDAGGSDRKVSAVIDGEAVFSEEVVWHPKTQPDPQYHYDGILSALRDAKKRMPRVDAIGVSSAGIYVNNRCMIASLFIKVPKDLFDQQVKDIYVRAAKEIGAPLVVANDGDVAALAGAMGMGLKGVLGIAMGTSEACGFVDADVRVKGWLNELAFAPVDLSDGAMVDEWSGDKGCGVKYFSQDGVIKLAGNLGVDLGAADTPAEKLKIVQGLAKEGDERAMSIYKSIGVYLGHAVALYNRFYGMQNVLVMGRVVSGAGGDVIVSEAWRVLCDEYSDVAKKTDILIPDEMTRRVGQSVAAASL